MISRQYQKVDSLDDVEIAPLRSLSRSSSRSPSSYDGRGYTNSNGSSFDESNGGASANHQEYYQLAQQALYVVIFVLLSWHVPRYLTAIESTIAMKLPPFQVLNDGQVLLNQELNHPLVDPATIPSSLLMFTSVLVPLIIIPIMAWSTHWRQQITTQQRIHHIHASICAFWTTLGLSEGPTQLLKLYVSRPRPNFYALCRFDATTKRCTADLSHLREANFSFPSGHSSLSACASVFMIWFVCGMILSKNNKLSFAQKRLFCALTSSLLLAWCIFVGASRLHDHWHHHSDVVAGLLLGSLAATLAYHVWYPPMWHRHCGEPYSLLEKGNGLEQQKKERVVIDIR
jgi:membrane-associated phospholipid phosphatase